jgi:hypothetical protein
LLKAGGLDADALAMAQPAHRQRSLVGEVRETLIRAGIAFGALAAIWYGLEHPSSPKPCTPATGAHADRLLTHCIGQTTSSVLWHWATILAVGALLGLAAGLSLALMIPTVGGRRARR